MVKVHKFKASFVEKKKERKRKRMNPNTYLISSKQAAHVEILSVGCRCRARMPCVAPWSLTAIKAAYAALIIGQKGSEHGDVIS